MDLFLTEYARTRFDLTGIQAAHPAQSVLDAAISFSPVTIAG